MLALKGTAGAVGTHVPAATPVCQGTARLRPQRRQTTISHALDPASAVDLVQHLPLLYEPVALPCSLARCGDLVHRSTLDLALRGELGGLDWRGGLLLASVGAYLFVPPGVLPGAFDYYWITRVRSQHAYIKDDVTVGRKLATGGFGTVFRGEMKLASGEVVDVIVKKAKEFGQAEAWMNERMMRTSGKHCAEFITAFDETLSTSVLPQARQGKKAKAGPAPVWLVWRYEGDNNLYNLMESREFPYNLEPLLLNRELQLPEGVERKAITLKLVMKQLLEALAAAHGTGIVHRDIKPQNCIVSERDKKIKLIDLGAAADLRVGINYVPSEYLLDPRYAPPQQYVMSTQTPQPPPAPVAAFLSPVLWRMENPDRFDMWSCGVTLLQMAFPALRTDNAIIAFNKRLEALRWDLRAWRAEEEARKGGMKADMAEGFALLDLDNGAGWELLCNLMAYKPTDRWSASEALLSRWFTGLQLTAPSGPIAAVAATSQVVLGNLGKWVNSVVDPAIMEGISNAATGKDRGSLTEAQLRQELGLEEAAPTAPRAASNTIVWWKERQSQLEKSIERRGSTSGLPMKGSKSRSRSTTPVAAPVPSPAPQGSSWLNAPFKNIGGGANGKAALNGNGNGNGNGHANGNGNGSGRVVKVGKAAPQREGSQGVVAAKREGSQGVTAASGSNGNGAGLLPKPLAGLLARGKSAEPEEEVEEEREVELVGGLLGMFKRGAK